MNGEASRPSKLPWFGWFLSVWLDNAVDDRERCTPIVKDDIQVWRLETPCAHCASSRGRRRSPRVATPDRSYRSPVLSAGLVHRPPGEEYSRIHSNSNCFSPDARAGGCGASP